MLLVPDDRWWTATFNANEMNGVEVYADVTTVPTWHHDGHMTCIDLDLDVYRLRDGSVHLDDEDEFDEHRVSFGYPDEIVEQARTSAAWLLDAVAERREPFGDAGPRWLERVVRA